jgi:hypothetical protein
MPTPWPAFSVEQERQVVQQCWICKTSPRLALTLFLLSGIQLAVELADERLSVGAGEQ